METKKRENGFIAVDNSTDPKDELDRSQRCRRPPSVCMKNKFHHESRINVTFFPPPSSTLAAAFQLNSLQKTVLAYMDRKKRLLSQMKQIKILRKLLSPQTHPCVVYMCVG